MYNTTRPRLGLTLQQSVMPGDQPDFMPPNMRRGMPSPPMQQEQGKPGFFKQGGLGRSLAGTLGDILLQQGGMDPIYAPVMQQQRQNAADEAQWTRRREASREDMEYSKQLDQRYREPPSIVRDAEAFMNMTDQQRLAYQAMRDAQSGPVNTTLPNGQFYSGPRSGLAEALQGGQVQRPTMPVGRLTPVTGGPAATPDNFRP